MSALVHLAGAYTHELGQRCIRCGYTLATPLAGKAWEGEVVPGGWREGGEIVVDGNLLTDVDACEAGSCDDVERCPVSVGPTGEAPLSDDPGDLGGLMVVMTVSDSRIRVDFGTSLSWVSMSPTEARIFAHALLGKALEVEQCSP